MKRSLAFKVAIWISMLGVFLISSVQTGLAQEILPPVESKSSEGPEPSTIQEPSTAGSVQVLYFYGNDCPHCLAVLEELIEPMLTEFGELLNVRLLEVGIPENYEALIVIESYFDVKGAERTIPTLLLDHEILVGENEIRERFPALVEDGIKAGGISLPEIPGIDPSSLVDETPELSLNSDEVCTADGGDNCVVEAPIYIGYFYQTGCKECSRVEVDLNYLKTKFPQIQVEEFNIYDHADLATWMAEQSQLEKEFKTPALFIGEDVLMGDLIQVENITPLLEKYRSTGTEPLWLSYDAEQGKQSIVERFKNMGWLGVVAAGLIDGINPCAFATLIFFVSYLTLSGRKGREVLYVGGAFTIGVFLAYLAVGLGLYQILEYLGETLDIIAKIVYILTAIFCLVLAVFSFADYRKARKGEIGDMILKLPESLRKRINATIRKGRSARNYSLGAFIAGILISFLELACTGQVYLPTIIFVSSIPELRTRAILYLILYNSLFVLPLVVIFVLVYFGTTSKDLTHFLQKQAAGVKFAMGLVFVLLTGWLFLSLVI